MADCKKGKKWWWLNFLRQERSSKDTPSPDSIFPHGHNKSLSKAEDTLESLIFPEMSSKNSNKFLPRMPLVFKEMVGSLVLTKAQEAQAHRLYFYISKSCNATFSNHLSQWKLENFAGRGGRHPWPVPHHRFATLSGSTTRVTISSLHVGSLNVLQQHPWVIFAYKVQRNFFWRLDVKIGAWIPALLRKGPACSQANCRRLAMMPPGTGEACVPSCPMLPPPRRLQLARAAGISQAFQTEYKGKIGVLGYLPAALASVDATSLFPARLCEIATPPGYSGEKALGSAPLRRRYPEHVMPGEWSAKTWELLGGTLEDQSPTRSLYLRETVPQLAILGSGTVDRPQPEKEGLLPLFRDSHAQPSIAFPPPVQF